MVTRARLFLDRLAKAASAVYQVMLKAHLLGMGRKERIP